MSRRRRNQPAGPFELAVEDLASDARGVGRDADGKAVFVADTLPGERVRYLRTRRRRHHDEGRLEEVLTASPERVDPRCPHFGVCGGCALQHLDPAAQIAFKERQLLEALERIGGLVPASVLPAVTGRRWGYRRRARLGVKHVPKKGGTLVGFRERGAPYIAVLEGCEVLIPDVGRRIAGLQRLLDGLSIRERVPQIEVAGGDDAVALVLRVLDEPNEADRQRLAEYSRETGLWFHLQPGGLDTVTPLLPETPELTYTLPAFDVRLAFRPTDFVQIHGEVNARMVAQAIDLLEPAPGERVLELFAGLGNFSLPLARRGARVTAVEGEAGLVARARENARANGLGDAVTAWDADLFQPSADAAWLAGDVDLALLDPPRAGAAEILPLVAAKGPRRIVYCSCHPATLARDAAELAGRGYRLRAAGVVDMFPHTAHVEAMALFER
ncbi:23S rRNA (uracil(1939)-C(5))-methyltransferase RlmD [Salinisphaera sp. PC39]|uniref:23S rRNA (uracil(1939)-C(5))-methyltransferase RlmD n=1 Tax=Salinisphaera sp. PC39 TaxID=1304156 RepID=UPI00334061F6